MQNRLARETLAAWLRPANAKNSQLLPPQPVPETIFAVAERQLILPTISPRLKSRKIPHDLPSDLGPALPAITRLNSERNNLIVAQACDVIRILNQAGIEPVALKGLAYILAGTLTDPGERFIGDLDLLIPAADIDSAVLALQTVGYSNLPVPVPALVQFHYHLLPLRPPAGQRGVLVELHRAVGPPPASAVLPADKLIAESRPMQMGSGLKVRIPSPEHLMTHLILHSQIVHQYSHRIWPPLRALDDLQSLVRHYGAAEINWQRITNAFHSAGQSSTLNLHLLHAAAEQWLTAPLPIKLGLLEKLRWRRRRILHHLPKLRYLDPTYWYCAAVRPRLRLTKQLLSTPGGAAIMAQIALQPSFYLRFLASILH